MRDERDRRRPLVWLTDKGHERLAEGLRVLSTDLLVKDFAGTTPEERQGLLSGIRALRCAAGPTEATGKKAR